MYSTSGLSMSWSIDSLGRLDLSNCMLKFVHDMFAVERLAREYYFEELTNLVSWDGKEVRGMEKERQYLHLVCKHGHAEPPLNVLMDIDTERVSRLPILKAAVTGKLPVRVFQQVRKNKQIDKIEVVVEGRDVDYVVILGCVKDYYVIRSAYPADETYISKVANSGVLIETIEPRA